MLQRSFRFGKIVLVRNRCDLCQRQQDALDVDYAPCGAIWTPRLELSVVGD